ncbi:MAG: CopG family antitoxin [Chloroflexota bacterium]
MTDIHQKLPTFASLEEEAAYWDTHSFAEGWDQGKPATIVNGKKYTEGITVRFPQDAIIELRETAQKTGIGTGSLIRMWVLERLHEKV